MNRHMWQWQVPALSERYRLVTYDLYGHGDSPRPPTSPSLDLFARQLAGVMDACGLERAAMVGFSLGGMIVRRFAMDYPQRVWALGILNSAHARDAAATAAVQLRVDQARRDGPAATVEAALVRWFSDAFRSAHPEVMELVRGWVLANDKAVYHTIYQVLVDGVDELVAPDPPITCPTLVMTAEEDTGQTPAMARAIAAEIPGAHTVIVPAMRHMSIVEGADIYNRALLALLDAAAPGRSSALATPKSTSAF
jgi:pimeloyl-ACP methyl ester carboxylesterase